MSGTNFVIEWSPTNTTGVISLDLGTGDSSDIKVVRSIASNIPNSGVCIVNYLFLIVTSLSNGQWITPFLLEPIILLKSPLGICSFLERFLTFQH